MKRIPTKYMFYLSLAIASIVFVFYLITNYIITLLNPVFSIILIIFVLSAAVLGTIISIGVSVFNPVVSEAMFTLRKLLRIENLSNPLILRLSSEAPGTYHHSLNVSTLAQKAAKSIGADALLIRTAAYYHDIGKLENPSQFIENQAGIDFPTQEDAESIRKSAEVIIAHVSNGIKIANTNKLPERIVDLISEHHGTTRALYFYSKAKEHGLKIKKTDFRYPGPTPGSKESAILMLSDCVEATTRSISNPTLLDINSIVDKAIEERLEEKQFKNSNISIKELETVGKSLKDNLQSIYHQRIDYKTNG